MFAKLLRRLRKRPTTDFVLVGLPFYEGLDWETGQAIARAAAKSAALKKEGQRA